MRGIGLDAGHHLLPGREGDKIRKVYLGSCRKMNRAEALNKAREMKKEALDKARPGPKRLSLLKMIYAAGVLCNRSYMNRANDT